MVRSRTLLRKVLAQGIKSVTIILPWLNGNFPAPPHAQTLPSFTHILCGGGGGGPPWTRQTSSWINPYVDVGFVDSDVGGYKMSPCFLHVQGGIGAVGFGLRRAARDVQHVGEYYFLS